MPDLHARMAPRVRRLTTEVVARCESEVSFYRELPKDVLDEEVSRSVAAVLGLLLRTLREDDVLGAGDLTELIAWSARRAEERVPLEAALTAYLIGAEVWWRALAETAGHEQLVEAGVNLLGCLRSAVPAVAIAHLQAQEDIRGEEGKVRRALVTALLSGQPHQELAEAARVTVAPAYEVLQIRFTTALPAARRTVRLVQSALDAHTGMPVLTALDHTGGVALLPGGLDLPALVTRVAEATDRPVVAATASAAEPGLIPEAAEEAGRVMSVVQRLGRPPGLYRFDDVLVEYQLARPGGGLVRLAAKLDPLNGHPHLVDTLRAFVNRGHNRRRTAQDLHIHRNTLDYRLRRVTALTGLDLMVPAEARLLEAALTARDLA
ncbi:PucR family transcriptional regulator [Streptosporangium roseum]|uniref:Transcriptional regulator, CdaR n=1 Tax=Streptosporangium roseum (strain ATCC 12428 / DSM 43021 / JCM 3005 / KCTC 9067 / NCIMB 10171 / NRRL 2505 / NI 9100) TaxID=479432 RepID=D2BF76_STRRD|nr:helix-turn-helix domain-containing protein [Streptosporangium roseum]ACZ88234.1 transcriptional regulator, CdaR [Streptosporangium roseum DSM 43021]